MGTSPQQQGQAVWDSSTICRETQESGPGARLLKPRELRLHRAKTQLQHRAGNPVHSTAGPPAHSTAAPRHMAQLTNGHARPWAPRSGCTGQPGTELLFTFPIAQCALMLRAYKQGDSGREKGTKGGGRHGQGSSAADRSPFSNWEGAIGAWGWEQPGLDAGLSSPKGTLEMSPDAAQGIPANWEAGRKKVRESRAPSPAPPQPASRRCLVAVPSALLPVTVSSSALPFLWSTTC